VLTRRGDRLYGRGTTDMKGFLASILALVPALLERNLGVPIHLALSYDEEVGCLGVRRLLADLAARDLRPIGCIVGEPTEMSVVRAHKGKRAHHVRARGLEAHTGVPHLGANAIEAAAEMITFLKNIGRRLRDEGPFDADFEAPAYTTIQTVLIRGGTAIN